METKTETQKRNARKRAAAKRVRLEQAALDVSSLVDQPGEWSLELRRFDIVLRACEPSVTIDPGPALSENQRAGTVGDSHLGKHQCSQTVVIYDCPFAFQGHQKPIYWMTTVYRPGYNSFDFSSDGSVAEVVASVMEALTCLEKAIQEEPNTPYSIVLLNGEGTEVKVWQGHLGLLAIGPADVLAVV